MAVITVPDQGQRFTDYLAAARLLSSINIEYQRWDCSGNISPDAPADAILAAYSSEIDSLKARGGYVTADVIDVNAATPGLDAMLARFAREHWHDEDEVRFIVAGRGVFHIRPPEGPVVGIEVESGDLISVPRGTRHWFDLCADRRIRAIRLFQDPSGWTPHYTESGIDAEYQPVCLGLTQIPPQGART